ncbi:hypothetical protein CC86DRAFT_411141 [Ophiobolus disseminans]|uniref:Metalloendopeptidase n=1 Tax=Ophiobolus disseminans TaxID=1469910 RepID=A0A6A6ZK75_9PLEO|nr:hypothetical protein CC86DRAFT_411141 [Ophiobolus disseminans]
MNQGGMGWSEIVTLSGKARTTWPDGLIQYCFTNEAARAEFGIDIQDAWKLWKDLIGDAGTANGHSLVFREFKFKEGAHPYCHSKSTENWNPDAPEDLAVFGFDSIPGVQAWSITGYMPKEFQNDPGRHGSRFDKESKNKYLRPYWVNTVAHKLGHVFGFWHEHQRDDRDSYIHFDCTKLTNYENSKATVEKEGKYTMAQICSNYYLALIHNFPAIQDFETIDHDAYDNDGKRHTLFLNTDLEFDDESIMLYSSAELTNPGKNGNDVTQVPLSFWKHRDMGYDPPEQFTKDNLELIPINWEVSHGDFEGIQHLYPWHG